jgi:hypothetical protein
MKQPHTSHVFDIILWWVVRLLYLSALTTLVPFVAHFIASGSLALPENVQYVPGAAFGILVICITVLFIHYHSVAHTLASLGWMTFVPGLIALFFQIVSPESFIATLETVGIGAGLVQNEIKEYINFVVPKVWLFIAVYLALGFILIHIAGKMEREHALTAQVRKLFGPRARILRKH